MKTVNRNNKILQDFQKSEYNPALDHLEGENIFKNQLGEAISTIKRYGLPKEIINKKSSVH
jgi:hypothetical protein